MQKDSFAKQVDRLRSVYSQAALSDERVQVLWSRFKHVEDHQFEQVVTKLIGEFTTQALPSVSRFEEALSTVRRDTGSSVNMHLAPPAHNCEACRDLGYGFVGDFIEKCICEAGHKVSPAELARQQVNYDKGRQLLKNRKSPFPPLPYDPNERHGA